MFSGRYCRQTQPIQVNAVVAQWIGISSFKTGGEKSTGNLHAALHFSSSSCKNRHGTWNGVLQMGLEV